MPKSFAVHRTFSQRFSLRNAYLLGFISMLLLWLLPVTGQAQFNYTTNNGTITITRYLGPRPNSVVVIPSAINGLPVTRIENQAFYDYTSLTNVTIPYSVTSIGEWAFAYCSNLRSITIPNSVTNIGIRVFWSCYNLADISISQNLPSIEYEMFYRCYSLTNVVIPDSVVIIGELAFEYCTNLAAVSIGRNVTNIDDQAFYRCDSLTKIIIPSSVTILGHTAFAYCTNLTVVLFQGNAPSVGFPALYNAATNAIVYYLPGTTGWGPTFAGRPTSLWNPQPQTSDANFGVRTNQFGFTITGASNLVLVVEAATNLAHPVWFPVATNTLTSGSFYFSDPQWTNYPGRFYRLRSP